VLAVPSGLMPGRANAVFSGRHTHFMTTGDPVAAMEKAGEKQHERMEKFSRDLERVRALSRDAIYRVTVLSASIVAFSSTVLSVRQLHLRANTTLLAASWCLFAAAVVLGPALVAVEARAQFIITWRSLQPQDFDMERRLTFRERAQLFFVLLYALTIRPRSLFFARHTDYDANAPTQGMWMNFRAVLAMHLVMDIALGLEIVLWLVFSAAMVVMVVALLP